MTNLNTVKITLDDVDPVALWGVNHGNLRLLEREFDSKIVARGREISIHGRNEEVRQIELLLKDLISHARNDHLCTEDDVLYALSQLKQRGTGPFKELGSTPLVLNTRKECIRPKTLGQRDYVEAMHAFDIVFAIGPAGTGKTYLAVALAVSALKKRRVSRIILVRPAVEAGESLGFLPGDLKEKIDPYLKPLYDALYDMLDGSYINKCIANGVIEVAPLAYMRGRTLNNSFVILDEAQNSSGAQMKMFLTRLGVNSKAVITGDITQVDLRDKSTSGLIQVQSILADVKGIKFVYLTKGDVVRHRLVQSIIRAYEQYEQADTETDREEYRGAE